MREAMRTCTLCRRLTPEGDCRLVSGQCVNDPGRPYFHSRPRLPKELEEALSAISSPVEQARARILAEEILGKE